MALKTATVTKKEVRKCLEVKKIYINIVFFLVLYALLVAGGICWIIWLGKTTGTIFTALASVIGVYLFVYQIIRLVRLVSSYNKFPCYLAKLDKVKLYMNGKVPVFAVSLPTVNGTKFVETNAIYNKKDIAQIRNKMAKILHDEKRDRIYIIATVD